MPAGPTIHHGHHDFRFGELRFARVHIYPSLAALNADAAYAVARLVYVLENQTYYIGKPGAWIELGAGGGGGGGGGGSVPDPADLDHQYPNVVGSVISVDVALSQFTLDIPNPGDFDHLQAGDALVISGSEDSGAVNWLDGTYDILAVDTVTGVVDVVPGSIPAIPNPPEVTFGNYAAVDQTYPSDGQLAVVNPDPDTGEPALWIYDSGDSSWHNANTLDTRLVFRDGSRLLSGWLALVAAQTNRPPTTQSLVTRNYVESILLGYSTGRHAITSITDTVVVFPTTDSAAVLAATGQQLVIAGTSTAADGTHTIVGVAWSLGVATVTIGSTGVTTVAPPGTVAIKVPNAALADDADVAVVAAALAAHIAALDPHPQYTTDAEATALAAAQVAAHVANLDPHPALPTVAEATAIADAAVDAHDTDPNAHDGAIAALSAVVGGGNVAQAQAIEPTAVYGSPLIVDTTSGLWKKRATDAQRPGGMAVGNGASTFIQDAYDETEVDATAPATITVAPAIVSRFKVGNFYRFPGMALNGTLWFRVLEVDEVTGDLLMACETAVTTEANQTTSVDELIPDGQVAISGLLELASGETVLSAQDLTDAEPGSNHVTIGGDARLELPNLLLVPNLLIAGSTGNDGTFPIESIDIAQRRIYLKPAASKQVFSENVESIVVSTRTIEFDAGADLSVLEIGDRVHLLTTTDNDGKYTIEAVDNLLKTVVVVEPLPGTNQAAPAGTGTGFAINRLSPLTNQYPPELTHLTGSIQAIDVNNGSGQAEITFDAGDDLSTLIPGDLLTITSATDPLNNVTDYEILLANNGTKVITLINTLPGADQAAPAGTGVVTGRHPGIDGTAAIVRPEPTYQPFGSVGDDFYADLADTAGISTDEHRYRMGKQVDINHFLLSVTPLLDGLVQAFSATGSVVPGRRVVAVVDATAGAVTLNLGAGVENDELWVQETSGVNGVTVDGDGSDTVEGGATAAVATGTGKHFIFVAGNWRRLLS